MSKKLFLVTLALGLQSLSANAVEPRETDWRTDENARRSRPFFMSLPRSNFRLHPVVDINIDPEFLKTKLEQFSGAVPTTLNGKQVTIVERGSVAGRALARDFLAQEYTRLGFQVSLHTYRNGANFVAEKVGTNASKVLILSAHFDSVGNSGADDDGAGTISVLAIAQALAGARFEHTLRVVGFDQEEKGLIGSQEYVDFLKNNGQLEGVIGNITLEMTAYSPDKLGTFHVIDCNRSDSTPLSDEVMNAVTVLKLPLSRSAACTTRSDHGSFWAKDKSAIVISEDFFGGKGNPCYHKSCDKVDKLNFTYMANITKAVAAATASILRVR